MKLTTQKTNLHKIELNLLLSCLSSFSVPIRKVNFLVFKVFNININNNAIILLMYIYINVNSDYFSQLLCTKNGFTNYHLQYLIKHNIVLKDITKTNNRYILNPLLINELNTQFEYIFKSLQKKVKLI